MVITINNIALYGKHFNFGLIGCNIIAKKASTDKNFEKMIDEKLYNITHPKDSTTSFSSNPYEYIKNPDSKDDYEYIMAIVCWEILKQDSVPNFIR